MIDKYVPKCITDYETFKNEKTPVQEKGRPSKNDSMVDCCPSSGYLVSRIMAELFIVSLIQFFFI